MSFEALFFITCLELSKQWQLVAAAASMVGWAEAAGRASLLAVYLGKLRSCTQQVSNTCLRPPRPSDAAQRAVGAYYLCTGQYLVWRMHDTIKCNLRSNC